MVCARPLTGVLAYTSPVMHRMTICLLRALGIPILAPAPRTIPGLETVEAPHDGSALMEFDYGVEAPLPDQVMGPPTEQNPVHEAVRRNPAAIQQINAFFNPGGTIIHPCEGPCAPE